MPRRYRHLLDGMVALALAVTACDPPTRAASPAKTEEASATVAAPSAPTPASATLSERAVRARLDAWLNAQNAGEFEAYAALYATKFEGVKRSGTRARHYDRERWLADRQKMFKRPMHVEANELKVRTSGKVAVLSFEQHWSSPTYEDVGEKQIVLLLENGTLQIGREEMISSKVLGHGDTLEKLALGAFLFVEDLRGPHVVLTPHADPKWARGTVALLSKEDPMVLRRNLKAGALPEAVSRLRGLRVQLYDATGPRCTATLGAAALFRRVVPHFGTRQYWAGEGMPEDTPRPTREEVRDTAWELGAGSDFVAAPLTGTEGDCSGALWARDASQPDPTVLTRAEPSPEIRATALKRFRAAPAWKAVQRDFEEETGTEAPKTRWDEYGGATPNVTVWTEPDSKRTWVTVAARAGAGCGDFEGTLWAAFEKHGGQWTPKTDVKGGEYVDPRAAFDVNGDGVVEFLGNDIGYLMRSVLFRRRGPGYVPTLVFEPEYHDCGC